MDIQVDVFDQTPSLDHTIQNTVFDYYLQSN